MNIKTPNPEIMLEAAQRIDIHESAFSCNAVALVSRHWYPPVKMYWEKSNARKWYEKLYEINTNKQRIFDNSDERVLALLFAYHIAMDEKGQFKMPVDETEEKINQIVKIGEELGLNCVILKNFIQSQLHGENKQANFDDDIAEGHNPQNLTNEQVGVANGWRLLSYEEIRFRFALEKDQTNKIQMWLLCSKHFNLSAQGSHTDYTYRTREPKDYFLKRTN